ncbi:unnamed protein product [marine sediment metagenome]|uniref:Uncharacterized protein n=1 Tax=marine sediment metagenome TaxID=412755 RepID=X0WGL0_9ZZZZ
MKRKYQRLAEVLGYDLGFNINHQLSQFRIIKIAGRQARVLWPNETVKSSNLRKQWISDVLWYSGINDKDET